MLNDGNLDWRVLIRDQNPTVNSIFECYYVLLELGPSKPAQSLATTRLHSLATKLELKSTASLLKKVERLEKRLPIMAKLFAKWTDQEVTQDSWAIHLKQFEDSQEAKLIVDLATAYNAMLEGPQKSAWLQLSVMTTNLISHRLLTDPIASFLKGWRLELEKTVSKADLPTEVDVSVTATEPYTVLDTVLEGDTTHDLLLVYCDSQQLRNENYIKDYKKDEFALHRCLITPLGWRPLQKDGASRDLEPMLANADMTFLENFRLSRTFHAEQIIPGPFWHEVQRVSLHRTDTRRTTPEVHAMVRAGVAVGFSHIEFLNEVDEKYIEYYELPEPMNQPGFFGSSKLVLFAPRHPDGSVRGKLVQLLHDKIEQHLNRMKRDYEISEHVAASLSRFGYTYNTAIAFEREKPRVDWWRGTLKLKVTPNLFVKGDIHLFGDPTFPVTAHRSPLGFGFVGRCVGIEQGTEGEAAKPVDERDAATLIGDGAYEIVLRGFELKQQTELFMATFVFELDHDAPYIIGLWTGRQELVTHPPRHDMGILIFHREGNLTLDDLNEILKQFIDANHLKTTFTKLPNAAFGKPTAE